ncbi:AAA family ATPase [Tissierella praeacuta]|uniref:AAA family ATPase n=1 Tax=Tissierella praeacuta TaxID=43131 RepID=UPI003DA62288
MIDKILINGRAGSGKDVFADYLVEKYGFKKITFADGIYDIAYKYFGMTYKDRGLLQAIGEKMREINPLVWVNYTLKVAEHYDKVVISDCRRANEYDFLLEKGFLPIHIEADLGLRIKRLEERDGFYPDLSLLENKSETGADGLDFIDVDNNNTTHELYRQIDKIMETDWNKTIKELQMKFTLRQIY